MSEMKRTYSFFANVTRVVDGDTLDVDVDLGFTVHVSIRIRLLGVDCPETYGVKHSSAEYERGLAAKQFVEKWCDGVERRVLIITTKSTGKYGRWLAQVREADELMAGGINFLNDALIREGHAKRYEG